MVVLGALWWGDVTFAAGAAAGKTPRQAESGSLQSYRVDADVSVLRAPKAGAAVVHVLTFGDDVDVYSGEFSGYKKVRVRLRRGEKVGYVQTSLQRSWALTPAKQFEGRPYTFYFSLVEAFYRQGERDLQTNPMTIYTISDFTGMSTFFELGIDYKLEDPWEIRVGLAARKMDLEGEAVADDAVTKNRFLLKESFLGLNVGAKYNPREWKRWGAIAGLEVSRGTSVDLVVLEGPPVDEGDIEMPVFSILYGGLTYQKQLNKHLVVEPALQLGSVVTADPVILMLEARLTLLF